MSGPLVQSAPPKEDAQSAWTVKRLGTVVLYGYVGLIIAYLILPVFIVFPMSVSPSRFMVFPPAEISWQWYREFFTSSAWLGSTRMSFQVGISASLIATALGTLAAFGIVRATFRGKSLLYAFLLSPWIMPPIILAISLFFMVSRSGLIGHWWVVAAAHAVFGIPPVLVIVAASLRSFPQRLEHAAMSLGADRLTTFRLVTFPLIRPAVLTGGLFAFLSSFDELLLALYLGGETAVTLPRRIWSGLRFSVNPTIAAVSSLLILVGLVLLVVVEVFNRKNARLRGE